MSCKGLGAPSIQGAALIIALVVLTMLLLLGLPLLLSQSASLSGSVGFHARQESGNGRDSAESLGRGLDVMVNGEQFAQPSTLHSNLAEDLRRVVGSLRDADAVVGPDELARVRVDTDRLGMGLGQGAAARNAATLIGLTLADEHGKLDVNSMDDSTWHRLLVAVGSNDWDDGYVVDPDDSAPLPDGQKWLRHTTHDSDDPDDDPESRYGQLAGALAGHRFYVKDPITDQASMRLTALEQLLDARLDNTPYGSGAGNGQLRKELTRQELEMLRPFITVASWGQGRSGLVDLGTVLAIKPKLPGDRDVRRGIPIFDGELEQQLGAGACILAKQPRRDGSFTHGWRAWKWPHIAESGLAANGVAPRDPLALEVPSAVNVHTAPRAVLRTLLYGEDAKLRDESLPSIWPVPTTTQYAGLDQLESTWGWGLAQGEPDLAAEDAVQQRYSAYGLLFPCENRYRRDSVPVGLRSWGLVRLQAGATALDLRERSVAEAYRESLVQALPPEQDLRLGWDDQADFHILTSNRHGSGLSTWPKARNRFQDAQLDSGTGAIGLGVLPGLAQLAQHQVPPQIERRWWRSYSGPVQADAPTSGSDEKDAPSVGSVNAADIEPDGLKLDGRLLAYAIKPGGDGIIERRKAGPTTLEELDGCQISLHFKPLASWKGKQVPILEIPVQSGNQQPAWDGSVNAGPDYYQNVWRVHWDGVAEYLVITLANAAIEHRVASGWTIPEDDFSDGTIHWNEQSLGSDSPLAREDLAPAVPHLGRRTGFFYKVVGGLPERRWYHLQVVIAHDRPGGQAIVLDGLVGRDASRMARSEPLQTGDHVTLPSLRLKTALPYADLRQGGRPLVLPRIQVEGSNILAELAGGTGLAEAVLPKRGTILVGNEFISYEQIQGDSLINCMRAVRQNTNQSWNFHPRVRNWSEAVGRRYGILEQHPVDTAVLPGGFRYRPITGTARIDTDNDGRPDTDVPVWPGPLFTGAATTAHPLPNGDPNPVSAYLAGDGQSIFRWRCWGTLSHLWADYDGQHQETDPVTGEQRVWIDRQSTELVLQTDPTRRWTEDIPPRGLLRIDGGGRDWLVWYGSFAGDRFSNLYWLTNGEGAGLNIRGLPSGALRDDADQSKWRVDDLNLDRPPKLWLISLEVTGDILGGRDFRSGSDLMQIMDPSTHRIEWVRYDGRNRLPATAGGALCFFNADGWHFQDRGQERTVFAGMYNELGGTAAIAPDLSFPASSSILPVQYANHAHFLLTGDAITVMPDTLDIGTPGGTPQQLLVRYAATDGYHSNPTQAPDTANPWIERARRDWDTVNERFTFTQRLSHAWDYETTHYEILAGTCWSGLDLSTVGRLNLLQTYMPRLDGLSPGYQINGPVDLYILGSPAAGSGGAEAMLDALTVSECFGRPRYTDINRWDQRPFRAMIGEVTAFAAGQTTLAVGAFDQELQSNVPQVFHFHPDRVPKAPSIPHGQGLGLVLAGGEVMAWESIHQQPLRIIGRGLLGSESLQHTLIPVDDDRHPGPSLGMPNQENPTILHLPIGPVAKLATGLGAGQFGGPIYVEDYSSGDEKAFGSLDQIWPAASAMLACKRDGKAYEYLKLIADPRIETNRTVNGPNAFYAAPWLRGLYHTVPQSFAANDLLIGQWHRHPSVLPNQSSQAWSQLGGEDQSAAMRSRSLAWASIPVRFRKTLFPSGDAAQVGGIDGADGRFALYGRALTGGADTFKWESATEVSGTGIASVFSDARFDKPVDGAEIKLLWRYVSAEIDGGDPASGQRSGAAAFFMGAADNANRSPKIGSMGVRVRSTTELLEQRGTR